MMKIVGVKLTWLDDPEDPGRTYRSKAECALDVERSAYESCVRNVCTIQMGQLIAQPIWGLVEAKNAIV